MLQNVISQKIKSPISRYEKQGFDDRTIIPPLGTAVHRHKKRQDQNRYLGNSMMMYCQEILP